MPAGEGPGAVLLFLGAQDVGGAAIAGEQVLAVLGVEEAPERLDPPDDHEQIVLARQREHRVDEVVPRALVAQVDFQAVGEEGEEAQRVDATNSRVFAERRGFRLECVMRRNFTSSASLRRTRACDANRTTELGFILARKFDIEHAAQHRARSSDRLSGSRSPFSSTIRITPSAARLSA